MMISALKITAERIADCGVFSAMMFSTLSCGKAPANMAGMMAKYLATSFATEKVVRAPRVMSNCLPISTTSISLVGLESRSTMFPASLAACVPAFMARPDVGLRQRGSVVGAVSGHGDEFALGLLGADQCEFVFRLRLREEIVESRFAGDGRGGERIVAGDHYRADPHGSQLIEALAHTALDDVLQVDGAENLAVFGHQKRRATGIGNFLYALFHFGRNAVAALRAVLGDRIEGAFADLAPVEIDAGHAGDGGERNETSRRRKTSSRPRRLYFSLASTTIERPSGVSSESEDELSRVGQLIFRDAGSGNEFRGAAVAQGDRAGFVEQQRIDIARRLNGSSRHSQHVPLDDAVHARNPDGGQANRRSS